MENLKKLYFKVKVQSREFKIPLGETYTGDELFYTILEFQKTTQAKKYQLKIKNGLTS